MGLWVLKCSFPPSLSTVALPGDQAWDPEWEGLLLLRVENGAPSLGLAGLPDVRTEMPTAWLCKYSSLDLMQR